MSAPTQQFDANSEPKLLNTAVTTDVSNPSFRNPIPSTSSGNDAMSAPIVPPRPTAIGVQPNYAISPYSYGGMNYGLNNYGGCGIGGYGGFNGGYGMTGMGMSPYSGFNRCGMGAMSPHGDMENRFIQMAEESTRPAFDSIQSLVNAVGSIAMMLENTFFALTSSFRAILGVAENFGRLRTLFAQFWSTFAMIRSLNWLIRKILVFLGIRTEAEFKAWAEAVQSSAPDASRPEQPRGSSWPILLFFGVISAAPYIVLRMLSRLNDNIIREKLNEPATWPATLRAVAQYNFQGTSPQELSFNAGQVLAVAPQHLQSNLWQSGWLMASKDGQHAGLVPVTYIKLFKLNKPNNGNSDNGTTVQNANRNSNQTVSDKPIAENIADLEQFYDQDL